MRRDWCGLQSAFLTAIACILNADSAAAGLYATSLVAGVEHNCAMRNDATVVCWGGNDFGQLGIGSQNYIGDSPNEMGNNLQAVDLGTGLYATALVAGDYHNCVLRSDGNVVCWGYNHDGEIGIGNTNNIGDEANEMGNNLQAVNLGTGLYATALFGAGFHTCVVRSDRSTVCWGYNQFGQLGIGSTRYIGDNPNEMGNNLMAVDLGTGLHATALSVGSTYTCAIRSDGSLVCWGENTNCQLGIGNNNNIGIAAGQMGNNLQAVDLGLHAAAITTAAATTCALRSDNSVVCWGDNTYGQLGIGSTASVGCVGGQMGNNLRAVDLGTGLHATALVAGYDHVCALRSDWSLVCWGHNNFGQLGIGSTNNVGDAANEMGNNLHAVDLGTGLHATALSTTMRSHHTCALRSDGSTVCWGWNNQGQLGIGSTIYVGDRDAANEMGNNLQAVDLGTGCPVGSYASIRGATTCTSCSAGTYSTASGSGNCSSCAAGSYASLSGATICTNCSAGTYSTASGSVTVNCSTCVAGSYASLAGSGNCSSCAAGSYASLSGSSSCTMCGIGSYQNASGKTACIPCRWNGATPDLASTSVSQCEQCGVGKVNPLDLLVQLGTQVKTGGLGVLSTVGVYTWWCLPVAACAPQNRTCFKYDENAEVFHYWGLPSDLGLG